MRREGDGRTALVTGASAGIGQAFAELLAARGYAVVLTARRRDRLESLAKRLADRHGVTTFVCIDDLADPAAPGRIADWLAAQSLQVDVLINNAGYGLPGGYLKSPWAEHQRFIQVMTTAVCELTYRLLPGMFERGWGRVINIASVAGLVPSPAGHTMYGASKAFLVRFSEALNAEGADRGVNVTALCPGFTYTEFHDVLGTREQMQGLPKMMWLNADDVAREGYEAVMRGEATYINGGIYRALVWLAAAMPKSVTKWVTSRAGRSYRKA
jgi:short-subunit dehydrogenase